MDAEVLLNELDLKKIVFKVYQKKWQILTVTLFAFLTAFIYTFNAQPRYLTSALIQVDSQLGSANNMQQILSSAETPFMSNSQASPADIEIALIKSRFILQSVIEKLGLNITVTPCYFPIIGYSIARHHQNELNKPLFGLSKFAWGGEQIKIANFDIHDDLTGIHFRLRKEDGDRYTLYLPDGHKILEGKLNQQATTSTDNKPYVSIRVNTLYANPGTTFDIALKLNDDVLKELNTNLSIVDLGDKSKTKTGVLQLSYEGDDPKDIPVILNTIVDFAITRNVEKKSAEASKTLDFLNRQLPSVRKSLQHAETELNLYRAKHGTIDISQEARIALMQLSAVESLVEFC